MKLTASLCLVFNVLLASAQNAPIYSHADSARAEAYYDSSWNYGLNSTRHQLYLDSALQIIPSYAAYWQQKAMPLYKMQKYQLARPFIDSAVKYDPGRYLDYRAFMECIFEKNYKDALTDLYVVKSMPRNNAVVMDHQYDFYIGLCHLQLNEYDSSVWYFKSCIEHDQKTIGDKWVHYNHYFYLGIAYYAQENYVAADEYFTNALKQHDKFCDAQYYKAMCLFIMNKKTEALALMETAYTNYTAGYGMTEDNAIYEPYPYQVRKQSYTGNLEYMRQKAGN